jgi:hypothetical protein
MNRKIYDPFKKMSDKQLDKMIEIDLESRNLKEKTTKPANGAGNFLHLSKTKAATA